MRRHKTTDQNQMTLWDINDTRIRNPVRHNNASYQEFHRWVGERHTPILLFDTPDKITARADRLLENECPSWIETTYAERMLDRWGYRLSKTVTIRGEIARVFEPVAKPSF